MATVSRKRVQEILREAREKINDDGKHWIKRWYKKDVEGVGLCYCSSGAIRAAATNIFEQNAAFRALAEKGIPDTEHKFDDDPEGTIVEFNDAEERVYAEVDAAFKRAIRALR